MVAMRQLLQAAAPRFHQTEESLYKVIADEVMKSNIPEENYKGDLASASVLRINPQEQKEVADKLLQYGVSADKMILALSRAAVLSSMDS